MYVVFHCKSVIVFDVADQFQVSIKCVNRGVNNYIQLHII